MKLNTIVSLIFLFLSLNGQAQPPSDVINEIVNTINDIREEGCRCGRKNMKPVGPVTWNDVLYATASSHASDMRRNNYFGHISKDGKDVGDRFDDFGYRWQFAGENLIMNPDMTEMGLAKRGKYWVQHFGKLIPENYKRTNTRYSEGN